MSLFWLILILFLLLINMMRVLNQKVSCPNSKLLRFYLHQIGSNPPQKGNPFQGLKKIISHKWYSKINLIIKDTNFELVASIDSGADLNCIQEGLTPTQYYEKNKESL